MRILIGVIALFGAVAGSAQESTKPKPVPRAAKSPLFDKKQFEIEADAWREKFSLDRDALRESMLLDREMERERMLLERDLSRQAMELERDASRQQFELERELGKTLWKLERDQSLMDECCGKLTFDVTKPGKFDALREKEFEARASFDMKSLHSDFGPKIFVQETYPRPSVQAHWKGDDDGMLRTTKRAWERSWPEDVADSLYRQARELLNRGEWRRAIAIFKDISQRYPNSAYVPDAMYWQAFSLYRIGGSTELREALTILETQRTRFPGSRTLADAATLSTRIRGALASRGDAAAAAQIARTASDSTQRCDQEELAVRVEALSALTQSDPDGASTILQRVLARRDECSVPLRRNAVFLIGGKRRDASAGATLIRVAKSDPSTEVRVAAIEWLSRIADDNALTALEELARSDSDNVQRAAVRALVVYPGPRARQHVRSIIERNDVPERLRSEALAAFDKERSDADDIAWLRAFYGRTDNIRLKQRVVSTLSRIGGTEVDQWLLSLARNNDESSEIRSVALRRVSQTLPIADVSRLYDASAERSVREELINALSNRTEAESTDKLIDIVKTGTDPQLRRQAISALTRKKDPRTTRLLMELLDK